MNVQDVLSGNAKFSIEQADCLTFLRALPDDCVDATMCSPPYELARLYLEKGKNIGIARKTEAWVDWLVEVWTECARVCTGVVAMVVAGQTKNFRWSAGPVLLVAKLHDKGFNLRNPAIFHRVGIPGSGGPDWLRSDYEWIICTSRPGKLPWSDNTACGHPPKWAPGGEMSNRLSDGSRVNEWVGSGKNTFRMADGSLVRQTGKWSQPGTLTKKELLEGEQPADVDLFGEAISESEPAGLNQWGHSLESGATVVASDGVVRSNGKRPSHRNKWGGTGNSTGGEGREPNGEHKVRLRTKGGSPKDGVGRRATSGHKDGDTLNDDSYDPPVLANPGNVVKATYTVDEVRQLLAACGVSDETASEMLHLKVGGGLMGSDSYQSALASKNEAPYPESLPMFFIKSFCRPGGVVLDPFLGSGTTAKVAVENGRRFVGCDLRQSQIDIALQRLAAVTPELFSGMPQSS